MQIERFHDATGETDCPLVGGRQVGRRGGADKEAVGRGEHCGLLIADCWLQSERREIGEKPSVEAVTKKASEWRSGSAARISERYGADEARVGGLAGECGEKQRRRKKIAARQG